MGHIAIGNFYQQSQHNCTLTVFDDNTVDPCRPKYDT